MPKEDLHRFLEHIRNRQDKLGVEKAFKFRIYIKKNQEFQAKYPGQVKEKRNTKKKNKQGQTQENAAIPETVSIPEVSELPCPTVSEAPCPTVTHENPRNRGDSDQPCPNDTVSLEKEKEKERRSERNIQNAETRRDCPASKDTPKKRKQSKVSKVDALAIEEGNRLLPRHPKRRH